MSKTFSLSGMGVITPNRDQKNLEFFEFHPDEQGVEVTNPCQANGKAQLMRDGTFYFMAGKPRTRANSTLLRKAAHGRISATRDGAYQLTLKIFKREGLNVKETLAREAFELIQNVDF